VNAGAASSSGRDSTSTTTDVAISNIEELHVETYNAAVQDIEWIDDGCLVAVALKGTNYLRIFNTLRCKVGNSFH
jgi:hypothetical protein